MITRAPDGLHHPSSESEVIQLICSARSSRRKLRVRGSGHSAAATILTGDQRDIHISLDRMTHL